MIILAIDTSCDETSVAISRDTTILSNIISSQVELHKKWGGVVPTIAQRAHQENIDKVLAEALVRAQLTIEQVDAIAVTYGPGLAIALGVGVAKAKELALRYDKPLIAVNHMIGHIYANLAKTKTGRSPVSEISYPALALLVSGKHTEIVLMNSETDLQVIGQTLDDAMGEAFDKVARMLNLGYPGGPIVAELAKEGNPYAFNFPVPMKQSGDLNYSFSGLKTSVLYTIKKLPNQQLSKQTVCDIAASFQRVAIESIVLKLTSAVKQYPVEQLLLGGGAVANLELRKAVRAAMKPYGVSVSYPNVKKLCTDNAAMIAVAASYMAKRGEFVTDREKLDRDPALHI